MIRLNARSVSMALALILFVEAAALAEGNTQTMGVSCFIPAIPGVNVPLDEKQAPGQQKPVVREQIIPPQQENQEEPSYAIAEDTQEVRAAEQAETPQLVRVKTFYSR